MKISNKLCIASIVVLFGAAAPSPVAAEHTDVGGPMAEHTDVGRGDFHLDSVVNMKFATSSFFEHTDVV